MNFAVSSQLVDRLAFACHGDFAVLARLAACSLSYTVSRPCAWSSLRASLPSQPVCNGFTSSP